MRILLTGGCGFLGHHITEHLLRNTDAEIVIVDRLTYASNGFDRLRDIKAWNDRRVHVLGCDLAQPLPEGIVHEIGLVDVIVHAAAETHVDNSIVDPLPFLQANVLGTHNLLMFARRLKSLKRVFCVSTDEVYGPAMLGAAVGFDENAAFRPANPYAAAKSGGECIAMAYANTYKLPITIVSTMNLFGERQHPEKFIPMVIRKVLNGEKVCIHADPTKTISGSRFYIHARNFASALLFLIERDALPLKIHVAGEREISNLELAKLIASVVGKPLDYVMTDFHSSRPGHDLRYCLDDTLIRLMGWQQPLNTVESLEKTVRWSLREENRRWLIM